MTTNAAAEQDTLPVTVLNTTITAETILASVTGVSRPLRVLGEDSCIYYCKFPNLSADPLSRTFDRAAEFITTGIATAMGAPVPPSCLVRISRNKLLAWYCRDEKLPERLTAHVTDDDVIMGMGMREITVDTRTISGPPHPVFRQRNPDNSRRHAAIYALWSLCLGADEQFFQDTQDRTYIYDLGLFFNSILDHEGEISAAHAQKKLFLAHHMRDFEFGGIKASDMREIAELINAIGHNEISTIITRIPGSWHISGDQLKAVADFLEQRAVWVARYLGQLADRIESLPLPSRYRQHTDREAARRDLRLAIAACEATNAAYHTTIAAQLRVPTSFLNAATSEHDVRPHRATNPANRTSSNFGLTLHSNHYH